jgi:hypothetical protein
MGAIQVLGVLEDSDHQMWPVVMRAVELAHATEARLTLAKTTDPGRLMRWFAPSASLQSCSLSCSCDNVQGFTEADYAFARAAEFVPAEIPIAKMLLGGDTAGSLLRLIRHGPFDFIVLTERLARDRRLRRALPRRDITVVLASVSQAQADLIGVLN